MDIVDFSERDTSFIIAIGFVRMLLVLWCDRLVGQRAMSEDKPLRVYAIQNEIMSDRCKLEE